MGTTLTGTTPQDTYDSLIKVTDNGPLSGTAKYLSDGLGNDSVLALSTARVGVATASPATTLDVAGTARISAATPTQEFFNTTNQDVWGSIFAQTSGTGSGASLVFSTKRDGLSATDKMIITQAGNVGINTTAVTSLLTVGNAYVGSAWEPLRSTGSPSLLATGGQNSIFRFIGGSYNTASSTSIDLSCATSKNLGIADTGFRISANTLASGVGASDGFLAFDSLTATVGGTFTTQRRLRLDADGLKFGSDTAAANALDDYEEGTWTPSLVLQSGSVTYTTQTGTYTKIGRQVVVRMKIVVNVASSPSGTLEVAGMPFTAASGTIGSISVWGTALAATSTQLVGTVTGSSTTMRLYDYASGTLTNPAADLQNGTGIDITATYFV